MACGTDAEDGADAAASADTAPATPSRARRDSAVAGSRLPGAGGVRAAMEASEAARRRTEASDSITN